MHITSKRIEILGGILHHLGTFDMSTFGGRLVLQKTVYLLQAIGIYLGYRFTWYVYGPYSPELTRDAFELATIYKGLRPYRFASPRHRQLFNKFIQFIADRKNDPIWLEAVASIHFLRRMYPNKQRQAIIRQVIDKQPYFNRTICNEAWLALEQLDS